MVAILKSSLQNLSPLPPRLKVKSTAVSFHWLQRNSSLLDWQMINNKVTCQPGSLLLHCGLSSEHYLCAYSGCRTLYINRAEAHYYDQKKGKSSSNPASPGSQL